MFWFLVSNVEGEKGLHVAFQAVLEFRFDGTPSVLVLDSSRRRGDACGELVVDESSPTRRISGTDPST